jgi:chromosome partitioning protein
MGPMQVSRVIAIANHKGGTAKTTTAVNVAASLAEWNQPTLLIDLDPQGNASSWLGVAPGQQETSLLANGASLDSLVRLSPVGGLSVVPASPGLADVERELAAEPDAETLLTRRLSAADLSPWRYVILDTPPARGLLTISALAASDEVLIPVEAHLLALNGVVQVLGTIRSIRERFNPRLKLAGFVLCRFDTRNRHCAEVRERLMASFPELVLRTVIRENIRLAEAPSFGLPIASYAPASSGAADYRALTSEIMAS